MAVALTYSGLYAACLAQLAVAQPNNSSFTGVTGDARFQAIFPMALNDAEGRIYTDVPFLNTRKVITSLTTTANSRTVSLAALSPPIDVPETFALLVNGSRVLFDRTQLEVINAIYPTQSTTVAPNFLDYQPRYWALQDDQTIVYAPTANAAYTVELVGLLNPAPMTPTNPTTYVGNTYPEVLMAAVMFYLNGGLKQNFGAMVEDPKAAATWNAVYEERCASAKVDEMRRRGLIPAVPVPPAPAKVN